MNALRLLLAVSVLVTSVPLASARPLGTMEYSTVFLPTNGLGDTEHSGPSVGLFVRAAPSRRTELDCLSGCPRLIHWHYEGPTSDISVQRFRVSYQGKALR